MAGHPSTKIDLRSNLDSVGVINDPWQALHTKINQIFHQKILVERTHVSDFEQFLKEISFSNIFVMCYALLKSNILDMKKELSVKFCSLMYSRGKKDTHPYNISTIELGSL